jgi:hypothetical protein
MAGDPILAGHYWSAIGSFNCRPSVKTITRAVGRNLLQLDRFGLLEGLQIQALSSDSVLENAKVIEKTAEDATVQLKNEARILLLRPSDLFSIALIGAKAE